MESYLSYRNIMVFFVALVVGAMATVSMVREGGATTEVLAASSGVDSPEIFNSAYSPAGFAGGEIVPASCSIGYPTDATDGWAPCPAINLTVTPNNTSVVGGGNINWNFTSTGAAICEFGTALSASGIGPSYSYMEGPNRAYNGFGPFANENGWARYTITCMRYDRTEPNSKNILVNTSKQPKVSLVFSQTNPFLNITSFSGNSLDETTGQLNWSVTGASSCSASGATGWTGSAIGLPNGSKAVYYSGTSPRTYTYTLTCTNGTETKAASASIYFAGNPPPPCGYGATCNID